MFVKENVFVIIVYVVGLFSVIATAILVDRSLKINLVTRADSIASLLNTSSTLSLQGNDTDLHNPDYRTLKARLYNLHSINQDSRFIYLVKKTPSGVVFLVDSEPPDSPDYSPPGQVYKEVSPIFLTAVEEGQQGWEISSDRWGVWITGYAPLFETQTGHYSALVGIDLNFYTNYLFPIVGYSSVPFFIFTIILVIMFYSKEKQKIEKQIIYEKEQVIRFAHHEIGTPVTKTKLACEILIDDPTIHKDPKTLLLTQEVYMNLMTLVRRTTNLLKTIELTVPQNLKLKEVDLIPLLEDAIESHHKLTEMKGQYIELVKPFPQHLCIKGDSRSLDIVFANLMAHALYHAKNTVEIAYKKDHEWHELMITSIGDTLTKEEVDLLFSAYYKGEPFPRHTESTGLGLYLIQKIVKLHQGKVSAITTEKGVSIVISLPVSH